MHITELLFSLSAGDSAPCVKIWPPIVLWTGVCVALDDAIRTPTIRVRGVVVVGVTTGVHIPRIIRIATIRRAQPAVLGL